MHQVFISYQNADRDLTEQLARGLEAAGFATWYYDRDSRVGFNYMEYLTEVIVECRAMVLLISPHSVQSAQVQREVIRASEENRRILPVLCGINYAQFQQAAPAWRHALAGIAAIELPHEGMSGILNRLTQALHNMGIQPGGVETGHDASRAPDLKLANRRIMLAYKRDAHPDEELLHFLESEIRLEGASVFIDRHLKPGMEWAREIEQQVRSSDIVIPLLSEASVHSEMLGLEVEIAKDAAQITLAQARSVSS